MPTLKFVEVSTETVLKAIGELLKTTFPDTDEIGALVADTDCFDPFGRQAVAIIPGPGKPSHGVAKSETAALRVTLETLGPNKFTVKVRYVNHYKATAWDFATRMEKMLQEKAASEWVRATPEFSQVEMIEVI